MSGILTARRKRPQPLRCSEADHSSSHRTQQSAQSASSHLYAAAPLLAAACTFSTFVRYEGTGDGGHPASGANRCDAEGAAVWARPSSYSLHPRWCVAPHGARPSARAAHQCCYTRAPAGGQTAADD